MDALRNIFNRLTLIMDGEAAIRFIDPVVFSICLPLWDNDGDGFITEAETMVNRRFPNTVFENRSDIVSLDDLAKLSSYDYMGAFKNMVNLVTASTGRRNNANMTSYQSYQDCTSLERVAIDESVEIIERLSFSRCSSLKKVIWGGNEYQISASAFDQSGIEDISLPESMRILENSVFSNCKLLRNIYLPPSITAIGDSCFYGCMALSIDINLPNLEKIDGAVFVDTSIKNVINLGKVTTLPHNGYFRGPFQDCASLETVMLPSTLTSMGKATFLRCTALQWVVCPCITPPTIENNSFQNTTCTIYVPDASVDAYKSATNWNSLSARIKPISEKP